jgi:hypothetical protein
MLARNCTKTWYQEDTNFGTFPDLHTRRSPTQSDTYQMLYWYNWFSWWWERGWSKHVKKWNKHIEKRILRQVVHLQELYHDARPTEPKMLLYCTLYIRMGLLPRGFKSNLFLVPPFSSYMPGPLYTIYIHSLNNKQPYQQLLDTFFI